MDKKQQPVNQWVNDNGTVVKIFVTDVPNKFTVMFNDKPWSPNRIMARVKAKPKY